MSEIGIVSGPDKLGCNRTSWRSFAADDLPVEVPTPDRRCSRSTLPPVHSSLLIAFGDRQNYAVGTTKDEVPYRCHALSAQTNYKNAKAISEASVQSIMGATDNFLSKINVDSTAQSCPRSVSLRL